MSPTGYRGSGSTRSVAVQARAPPRRRDRSPRRRPASAAGSPCAPRRPARAGRARRVACRCVTTAAARPGTSHASTCGSVRDLDADSASQTRSTTPFMSKKSTVARAAAPVLGRRCPVQAHASARRSPRGREKRAPISNSRTSRCSRRRLCATASTRPGSADGRSTAKFSDSGLAIGTRSPSAGERRRGGLRRRSRTSRPRRNPAPVMTRAQLPRARDARVGRRRRRGQRGKRHRQLVEAVVARDLLDQIDLAQHVHAPRRHRTRASRRSPRVEREPEARRGCARRRRRESSTPSSPAIRARRSRSDAGSIPKGTRTGRRPCRARVPAPVCFEQRQRPLHRGRRQLRIGAALEAHAGFRLQAELPARPPHRQRVEVRALEDDRRRRAGHLGVGAAHDAGDRQRAVPRRQ